LPEQEIIYLGLLSVTSWHKSKWRYVTTFT